MLIKTIKLLQVSNRVRFFHTKLCSTLADHVEHQEISDIPADTIEQKILRVAVIGMPNAGKSTFINNLMDRKVCAVSSKVHTTKTKSKAIFTEDDTQIVFLDTPGLVTYNELRKFNLPRSFYIDGKTSLEQADIVGVLHDTSNTYTRERLDLKVIRLLEDNYKKPSFLVLNKIDQLKSKRKLLDITRSTTNNCLQGKLIPGCKEMPSGDDGTRGWPNFQDIFMISALTGDGMSEIKNYLLEMAKPGKWMYPVDTWSDQKPENLVINAVKARFLDFLQQEIPYSLELKIELFEKNEEGTISTVVLVNCPTDRIVKLISGDNDGRIRKITSRVQEDLQNVFQTFVRIQLILQSTNKANKTK